MAKSPRISRLGMSAFVAFTCVAGCSERDRPVGLAGSAPVVLTVYWDPQPDPQGHIQMSVTGELMTSSSNDAANPAQVRMVSGSIDDTHARGFALYKGRSTNPPVFRVVGAPSVIDGRFLAMLAGESSVHWLLVVEGTSSARIHDTSGRNLPSPTGFSPGPFLINVDDENGT